jgi:tetratricopeptide (TPR) repeat protein
MLRAAFLLVAALLLMPAPARADVATAREHYQKGKVYYDLQRYLEAAREYELAYEAKDDPALLFNIGQSYRLGGEPGKALGAYRAYLRNVPDAPNRAEIEARIVDMQRLVDEQKRAREAPPNAPIATPAIEPQPAPAAATTPPPVVDARAGRTKRIAGIAVAGFGVAALATGLALELVARSDNDQLTHPAKGAVFDPALESAVKNDQAAGIALLAIGGAAVAAGTTLFVIGTRERKPATTAWAPLVGTSFVGASFRAVY